MYKRLNLNKGCITRQCRQCERDRLKIGGPVKPGVIVKVRAALERGLTINALTAAKRPTRLTPAGGGNVSNSGTPTANQFALWTSSTAIQGVSPASKSDQQTGTSTTAAVTPSQQQSHDSASKARNYSTLSGTTLTNQFQYNATAARTAVGTYTMTWGTAFASANYDCHPSANKSGLIIPTLIKTQVAGSLEVDTFNASGLTAVEVDNIGIECGGRQ